MAQSASDSVQGSGGFSSAQKEYLEGYLRGAAGVASAGMAGTATAPAPYSEKESAGYKAQQAWLAAGKRLSKEEKIKFEGNPLEAWNRIAELSDSTAIVRKLAPNRRLIVAAPDYLKHRGTPKVPEDLLDHNCLLLRFPGSKQYRWTVQGPDGPITLRVNGNMDSNSGEALRDWCLAGHGLALKSLWEVVADLNEGRLVPVLTDFPSSAVTRLSEEKRAISDPPRP